MFHHKYLCFSQVESGKTVSSHAEEHVDTDDSESSDDDVESYDNVHDDATAYSMSETDRTSSGNAQVDILLSHRGQKVAYNNINVPDRKSTRLNSSHRP